MAREPTLLPISRYPSPPGALDASNKFHSPQNSNNLPFTQHQLNGVFRIECKARPCKHEPTRINDLFVEKFIGWRQAGGETANETGEEEDDERLFGGFRGVRVWRGAAGRTGELAVMSPRNNRTIANSPYTLPSAFRSYLGCSATPTIAKNDESVIICVLSSIWEKPLNICTMLCISANVLCAVASSYCPTDQASPGMSMGLIALAFEDRVQDIVGEAYDPVEWKWGVREFLLVDIHVRLWQLWCFLWILRAFRVCLPPWQKIGKTNVSHEFVDRQKMTFSPSIKGFGRHGAVFGKA
ncbi:hypothetical protein BU17DRAFT_71787 [Hysterangium stoloniferum]|nr:hypothetical protein BU17DRAFT_71787 [Hysterangium stoloniferum]